MMLGHYAILDRLNTGAMRVSPRPAHIGANSIDLRLGTELTLVTPARAECVTIGDKDSFEFTPVKPDPVSGIAVLLPNMLYHAKTLERVWAGYDCTACIDGRSTCGRSGLSIHQQAGFGDVGYDGQWTLEITVVYPTRVRLSVKDPDTGRLLVEGMRVANMFFFQVKNPGDYAACSGNYQGGRSLDELATINA